MIKRQNFYIYNLCTYLKPNIKSNLIDIACGRIRHAVYLNKEVYCITRVDF
jgi:hypothetical protein